MNKVKEILTEQLERLGEQKNEVTSASYAMCEVTKVLIAIERAQVARERFESAKKATSGRK